MTSSDPDVIRRQIEDTRRELSYDVDALNEKVNPARVVDRRVTAAKGRRDPREGQGDGQRPGHHLLGPRHGVQRAGSVQGARHAVSTVQDAASSRPAPYSRRRSRSSARRRATRWPPG